MPIRYLAFLLFMATSAGCDSDAIEAFANDRLCRGQPATRMSGEVRNMTWTRSQSPYVLTGAVRVLDSLRVEAGTVVCADSGVGIRVDGALIAMGTAAAPIIFTASAQPAPWSGITTSLDHFSNDTSRLRHVRIEFATVGVEYHGALHMDSSHVRQIRGPGLWLSSHASDARIAHTVIDTAALSGGPAVLLEGGVFEQNLIRGSGGVGLEIGRRSRAQLLGGRIEGSAGVGIWSQYHTGLLTAAAPVRVTGSGSYPVELPVHLIQRLWPTEHLDSLRDNQKDTIVFFGSVVDELVIPAGLPWRGTVREFSDVVAPGGSIRVQAGAQLSGTVWLAGGRLIAEGTLDHPASLDGQFVFRGNAPVQSTLDHVSAHGQFLATGTHALHISHATFAAGSTVYLGASASQLRDVKMTRGVGFELAGPTPINARAGLVLAGAAIVARNLTIEDSPGFGILITGDRTSIVNCEVRNNAEGIRVELASGVAVTACNIHDNAGMGLINDGPDLVAAEDNWWGDPAGPTAPGGDGITGNIRYTPFRTSRVIW